MQYKTIKSLWDVWCSSQTDVFAVGDSGTILHYVPCLIEKIYGGYSNETERLRHFRDNILSTTPEGQEIIRLYYKWSPAIVKAIEDDEEFKKEVKETIDGIMLLIE
jgi:hypothetical protein